MKRFSVESPMDSILLLNKLYLKNDEVKEHEMGRVCRTRGEKINAYRVLTGKPEGKTPL
jgi:hypothetical protein